jgi:hypothetical protein
MQICKLSKWLIAKCKMWCDVDPAPKSITALSHHVQDPVIVNLTASRKSISWTMPPAFILLILNQQQCTQGRTMHSGGFPPKLQRPLCFQTTQLTPANKQDNCKHKRHCFSMSHLSYVVKTLIWFLMRRCAVNAGLPLKDCYKVQFVRAALHSCGLWTLKSLSTWNSTT